MEQFNGCDRRISESRESEFFVEIGVNYFRTVGTSAALAYLEAHSISPEVACRVTSRQQPRRRTRWECHLNEAALRYALGARPLLPEHGTTESGQY